MIIKDCNGNNIKVSQAKSGKIIIPFGSIFFTLSKSDSEKISCLYEIDDFDQDAYINAYKNEKTIKDLINQIKRTTNALEHARNWIKKLKNDFNDNGCYSKICNENYNLLCEIDNNIIFFT